MFRTPLGALALLSFLPLVAQEASDVADVPSEELRVGKDDDQRYVLISARDDKPKGKGHALVLVLPGGSGGLDFLPFVKRIWKYAVPDDHIVVQLVPPRWTEDQEVIWPTEKVRAPKMKRTTEELARNVLKEVRKKHPIDPDRVFTLSWSSGGPAAYAISLSVPEVKGSFIAMSVFKPDFLPPLAKARKHAYWLLHSPDDKVCPYRMAEEANTALPKHEARVHLETYDGGHGWNLPVWPAIRKGLEWLAAKP